MKLKLVLIDSGGGIERPLKPETDFDKGEKHIDRWLYSPPSSSKIVLSEFSELSQSSE